MGMFDDIGVVGINHPEFDGNGESFQTKDMECERIQFYVFNNRLWKRSESPGSLEDMEQVLFDGQLNIYTKIHRDTYSQWLEYDLIFDDGVVVGVNNLSSEKQFKDLSAYRPGIPNERAEVRIDLSNCPNEMTKYFYLNLEENLDTIRNIVGDPKATMHYTQKPSIEESSGLKPMARGNKRGMVTSVVQCLSDIELAGSQGSKTIQVPSGDSLKIIFDEASEYLG